jgi:phage regulator Rha-like protein
MTRDGFWMLVMGFSGKKAAKLREDYIGEFNRMERALAGSGKGLQRAYTLASKAFDETKALASNPGAR